MKPRKGQRQLREGRWSEIARIYFLTTITQARRPLFRQTKCAELVLESLCWLEKNKRIYLLAAVVMPDHVHFVAQLKSGNLSWVMQSFKGYTARAINRLLGEHGSIWQSQYHDHAVRNDESLRTLSLYCIQNPVRAGLVQDFHDYPFWYCRYDV